MPPISPPMTRSWSAMKVAPTSCTISSPLSSALNFNQYSFLIGIICIFTLFDYLSHYLCTWSPITYLFHHPLRLSLDRGSNKILFPHMLQVHIPKTSVPATGKSLTRLDWVSHPLMLSINPPRGGLPRCPKSLRFSWMMWLRENRIPLKGYIEHQTPLAMFCHEVALLQL